MPLGAMLGATAADSAPNSAWLMDAATARRSPSTRCPYTSLVIVMLACPRISDTLRPENWTRPAGVSPARVVAGEPGSRPRFAVERRRAERGVESLFGGSKRAGRSVTRRESCSLVRPTMGKPSRSCRGEGNTGCGRSGRACAGFLRGMGIGTCAWPGPGQERPVCAASSAKTARISQW